MEHKELAENKRYKILNQGFLRLVESMGNDLSIIRNARVSYDAEWRAGEDEGSDARLINYLMMNGHNTPFESVIITFEIKAPIFVVRQWHRHRTQSYNELSARYRELPDEWYLPEIKDITTQSKNNKQMKTESINPHSEEIQTAIQKQNKYTFECYHQLLSKGCPREIARSILPVGTYTHMFATANLHNWFNFLRERLHPHAQYEISVYAKAILEEIKQITPIAAESFTKKLG